MKIRIIQIGKTRRQFILEGEKEYLKRLQSDVRIETITLKEFAAVKDASGREKAKEKEGADIIRHLAPESFVIALDQGGKSMDSVKFAQFLSRKRDFEGADVTFVIGGPYGLSREVLAKAGLVLSFSGFTFTHEIIRLLLLEQIYRAMTIIKGKTYHY